MKKEKVIVMYLVRKICHMESTGCRSLNKVEVARQLMDLANIPGNAKIQEIPLDWNKQVVILFLLPDDENYYSLFAGIGKDKKFHFELTIAGILKGNEFEFFDEEKELDINYFREGEVNEDRRLYIHSAFLHCKY